MLEIFEDSNLITRRKDKTNNRRRLENYKLFIRNIDSHNLQHFQRDVTLIYLILFDLNVNWIF